MPDVTAAISFLNNLNHAHDAVNFIMELETKQTFSAAINCIVLVAFQPKRP